MTNHTEEVEKVLEFLKKGIELESFGIKFFTEAAREVTDPKGRQTLEYLANEERDHLKFIKDLETTFKNREGKKAKSIIKTWTTESRDRVFPEIGKYLEDVKAKRGDQKILEESEEIEIRSIKLYKGALDKVEKEDSREIFNVLIKEEEGHLALVQQMRDYMSIHGVWSGLEDYFANE
jgi:rubrerythrin